MIKLLLGPRCQQQHLPQQVRYFGSRRRHFRRPSYQAISIVGTTTTGTSSDELLPPSTILTIGRMVFVPASKIRIVASCRPVELHFLF
jgi:hypothetical protein